MASVRASGAEKERSCPTVCATSPIMVGRHRSFRNWSVYQDRGPRWVGPDGPALASMRQQAFAPAEGWKSGRTDLEYRSLGCGEQNENNNRLFGSQRQHQAPSTSQLDQQRSGARVQNFQKSSNTRSMGQRSLSSTTTKAAIWQPATTLPRPFQHKVETPAQRADVTPTKRLPAGLRPAVEVDCVNDRFSVFDFLFFGGLLIFTNTSSLTVFRLVQEIHVLNVMFFMRFTSGQCVGLLILHFCPTRVYF